MSRKNQEVNDQVEATEAEAEVTQEEMAQAVKTTKKAQMREAFKGGKSRGEIAKEFGVKYQTVYAATKDMEGTSGSGGGRGRITLTEGPGAGMGRAEYIRQEFAKGRKRGEIAKELGVAYQIVFQATKGAKAPEAKEVTIEEALEAVSEPGDEEEVEIEFEDSDELPE